MLIFCVIKLTVIKKEYESADEQSAFSKRLDDARSSASLNLKITFALTFVLGLLIAKEFSNIGTDHCIRNLRNYNFVTVALSFSAHNLCLAAYSYFPSSCLINRKQLVLVCHNSAYSQFHDTQDER